MNYFINENLKIKFQNSDTYHPRPYSSTLIAPPSLSSMQLNPITTLFLIWWGSSSNGHCFYPTMSSGAPQGPSVNPIIGKATPPRRCRTVPQAMLIIPPRQQVPQIHASDKTRFSKFMFSNNFFFLYIKNSS